MSKSKRVVLISIGNFASASEISKYIMPILQYLSQLKLNYFYIALQEYLDYVEL